MFLLGSTISPVGIVVMVVVAATVVVAAVVDASLFLISTIKVC